MKPAVFLCLLLCAAVCGLGEASGAVPLFHGSYDLPADAVLPTSMAAAAAGSRRLMALPGKGNSTGPPSMFVTTVLSGFLKSGNKNLILDLPGRFNLTIKPNSANPQQKMTFNSKISTWAGSIAGKDKARSVVVFVTSQSTTRGVIRMILAGQVVRFQVAPITNANGQYAEAQDGSILHAVTEVPEPVDPNHPAAPYAQRRDAIADSATLPRRNLLQTSQVTTDLLIVYTPAASSSAGGDSVIEGYAMTAVRLANEAYAASGVNMVLRLVGLRKVSYSESGKSTGTVLDDITNNKIPNVFSWREELGADLVSIFQNNNDYCGIGWMFCGRCSNPSAYGFTAICRGCWDTYTTAHEIGHNHGCNHNVETAASGDVPYSYGFRRCDLGSNNFRTIMSYSCDNNVNSARVGLFSGPNNKYNNIVAGSSSTADCSRIHRENMVAVSNFRKTAGTKAPPPAVRSPPPATSGAVCVTGYGTALTGYYPYQWGTDAVLVSSSLVTQGQVLDQYGCNCLCVKVGTGCVAWASFPASTSPPFKCYVYSFVNLNTAKSASGVWIGYKQFESSTGRRLTLEAAAGAEGAGLVLQTVPPKV